MRSIKETLQGYLESYPLSDRATFIYDMRAGFWSGVFNGLAIPLIGVVGRRLGMSTTMLAILMGSQFVGLFLNLWFGHLARSGDLVAYVFWPGALSRAALALVAFVASPLAFLVVVGFFFLTSNFGGPAYSSLMRSNYSDANRARAMGHIRILLMGVSALCAPLGGAFLQIYPGGYRILFPIAAAAGVASMLLFRKIKPRRGRDADFGQPPRKERFRDSLALIGKDKPFLSYMGIFFIIGFADKLLIPLEPIRLVDELGAGYGASSFVLGTVPLAAAVLGYFICTRLADRVDPFLLLVATALLSSTRLLAFALAGTTTDLIAGCFFGGMANAGWDLLPLFTIILFADKSRFGPYIGFHFTLVGLRGLLGPVLGTWLYEGAGMRIVDIYWLAFALVMAGAVLLALFWLSLKRTGNLRRSAA